MRLDKYKIAKVIWQNSIQSENIVPLIKLFFHTWNKVHSNLSTVDAVLEWLVFINVYQDDISLYRFCFKWFILKTLIQSH